MTYEVVEQVGGADGTGPTWEVRRTPETTSTNADLLALARGGAPEGVVLVADHQTAGRGRLDRTWQAPPGGSLLLSVLTRPAEPPRSLAVDQLHLVSNAVGVAAANAARTVTGVDVGLKWPNDLVIETDDGTRKVSGILAETVLVDGRAEALVVGIGINVTWPADLPDELADIAIALNHAAGHPVDRDELLHAFLVELGHWYAALATPAGRGELLGRYRELSATIGRRVRVELASETVVGDAIDVSADGHLLVVDECPDRPREIVAGDVVHLRPHDGVTPDLMRIVLDGTAFLDRRTGVGVFLDEVARRLVRRPDLEVGAFAMTLLGYGAFEKRVPLGLHAFTTPVPAPQLRRRWAESDDPVIEWWTGSADVFHGPNFLVPPARTGAEIVTVHDLTALHYPQMCTEEVLLYPRYIERAAARGAWIHTVSHHVADEVREHFRIDPERVVVVPNGVVSVPDADPAVGRALAGGSPYVLAVGTIEPRKDHPTLVRAFDLLAEQDPDLRLVVVGQDGWGTDAFEAALGAARHADRVVRLGWTSEADRMALLHGAELLAYASVYEGFGLPPLEAMTAGIPVVATAAGAVPEVVGDAAEVVAVGDAEALAAAMGTVLGDAARRAELVALGHRNVARYSWDRTTDQMVHLYERAAADRRGRTGAPPAGSWLARRRPMVTLTAPPGRQGHDGASPETVRIVVLNFNGGDDVVRCVEALYAAAPASGPGRPALGLEVVVVDNASTDGSPEALAARFDELLIVHNPTNTGFPANNLALRDLEGVRFVGLVNPDVFVEPGWLDPLIDVLQDDPTIGAACPLVLFEDRFVDVEVTSPTSSPGGGDAVELGVHVSGAVAGGADVWAGVRVDGVDFGPEQGPAGMFRWTGDRTVLRIPVPSAGPIPATVGLTVTSVLGPRRVTFRCGDEVIEVDAGPEPVTVTVPLADLPHDLVNNAGSIVFDDGYGADRAYLEPFGPELDRECDVFAFTGGAVLLRPIFLDAVDLLDKRFFLYYEDTDLSWRGVATGWRYRFVPRSVVRHRHSAIVGEGSPTAVYFNERNRLMMLVKNAPTAMAVRETAAFAGSIVGTVAEVGERVLRRRGRLMTADRTDLARSMLHARALLGVASQAPFLARRRRHLRKVQRVGDDAIVARLEPRRRGDP